MGSETQGLQGTSLNSWTTKGGKQGKKTPAKKVHR